MTTTRVLVVDDSPTIRQLICAVLGEDPEIEVVGVAGDANEARQAIKDLNPDVITLDVEMPNMSGIQFLDKLMRLRPTPVVMVSTLTANGSEAAIEALSLGAVDCVMKPTIANPKTLEELAAKVKMARYANVSRRSGEHAARQETVRQGAVQDGVVVAIGSSTGGVEALIAVISCFPDNCAPAVIVQHMPKQHTKTLANRLDRLCPPHVVEATHGARLQTGHVYLAPGGDTHTEIANHHGALTCILKRADHVNGHRPSVDVLFNSVAKVAGSRAIGLILTGMGSDGAKGLLAMRNSGARTLGQCKESCVVYGMPRAAREIGAVEVEWPLQKIGVEATALACSLNQGMKNATC